MLADHMDRFLASFVGNDLSAVFLAVVCEIYGRHSLDRSFAAYAVQEKDQSRKKGVPAGSFGSCIFPLQHYSVSVKLSVNYLFPMGNAEQFPILCSVFCCCIVFSAERRRKELSRSRHSLLGKRTHNTDPILCFSL